MAAVRDLLEKFSFEDGFEVLGVAPRASGLCVATAAGPEGAIVPVRDGFQPGTIPPAVSFPT